LVLVFATSSWAQLTGHKYIPGSGGPNDYSTIALAIADLNAQGVGTGGVTFNVASGYTETITAALSVTATGTSGNQIVFQKSGGGINPLITAYTTGIGTPSSAVQDGIWNLIGSDYVTINGIDLLDPNTTNPSTMEYGYGMFKANVTDGCRYNTIKNCNVSLSKENNESGNSIALDGSRAINVVNALFTDQTTVLIPTQISGTNSYNKFYSNTLKNCNYGIALIGYADISPFTLCDFGNDIGGTTPETGNTILNFGGVGGDTTTAGLPNPSAAIRTLAQYDINVSYNTINNNDGTGKNHKSTLRGIYLNTAVSANANITNNTLTIKSWVKTNQVSVIENVSGATAASNTVQISNNTITNCLNDSTTTGIWYGIYNTASCANLSINNNTFLNNTTKITGNAATYLIYNAGAVSTLDSICYNSLTYNHTGATACIGQTHGINNGGAAATCNVVINHNNFSNFNYTITGTANLFFVNSGGSPFNLEISNNTLSNLTLNHSGNEWMFNNSAQVKGNILNFTNNSIVGTYARTANTGTLYLWGSSGSSVLETVITIADNNFSNITSVVNTATGTFNGINEATTSPVPYALKNVYNNVVSNVTISSPGSCIGLFINNPGPGISNTPSRIYDNTITNINTAGNANALQMGSTSSISHKALVYNNTINTISSSGVSTTVNGANIASSGAGIEFYKNTISNIKATGATAFANGILIPSGGINTNVYNNFISDIKALNNTNTTITDGVRGISITSTSTNSTINLYYNTIYLDATSTGTNFSSSAVFHTLTVLASSAALNMQNNILVNNSTPKGTGIASAFRRSAATSIVNISPSCNFNCFYAGTPDTKHLIYYDGTNSDQSITAYRTRVVDRDLQSFRELPPFSNITTLPYDLHLTSSAATQCESGGQQISGITTDYDEDGRYGSVSPPYTGVGTLTDIGADEGDFLMATDIIAPVIVYTPVLNTAFPSTTITATITDPSGVPSTLGDPGLPLLNWKINVPGSWNTSIANPLGNNQYSFTFGSGANSGDSILYYIVAQDGAANVGTFPSLGSAGFGLNPPSASTPPTNLYKYKKLTAMSGNYTIDTSLVTGGTNFKTFTDAIAFLNSSGIIAPVTFNVTANQSWSNTCSGSPSIALKITNTTTSASKTVTFQKNGVGSNPVINIKGTAGSDYGIYLEDAKYITFDGIDVVDAGTSASNWIEYGIYLKGISIGCQNNTVKNADINMERSIASYGIYSSSAASPFIGSNSYNKFYNNTIREARFGYYLLGVNIYKDTLNEIGNISSGNSLIQSIGSSTVASTPNAIYGNYQEGLKIFNTTIDTVIALNSVISGMEITNSSNLNIFGNTLKNFSKYGTTGNSDVMLMNITNSTAGTHNIYMNTMFDCSIPATALSGNLNAMRIYGGTDCNWNVYGNTAYNLFNYKGVVTGVYHNVGSGITTTNIYNNKLYNLTCYAAASYVPVIFGGQNTNTYNVYNNFIYDIKNAASTISTQPAVQGISVGGGNWKIYNNTVNLDYVSSNAANTSAALYVSTSAAIVDVRNNIFVNKCDMTTGARAVAFWYTGKLPYTNIASTSNNNLFYGGIPSAKNLIFCDSLAPTATTYFIQTLDEYKTISGKDANSVTEDPPFVSNIAPYNFHMQTTVPTITEGRGQVIATVTTDFDGDTRNATTPDIGADEFTGTPVVDCSGTPAIATINGASSVCINTGTALTLSPINTDLGITHQWAYSNTPGGPYTNLGILNSQLTGNISATTYYIDTIRCTNSGLYIVTAEKMITINAYPVSSAAVATSPICANATLELLGTTDIGTSFNWTGPNGFTSTSQNPSIASVTTSASGIYSFTSTSNGCVSPASTVAVVVNQTPSAITITPSTASLCEGNIQNLVASGGIVTGAIILNENFNDSLVSSTNWTRTNISTGGTPANAAFTNRPDGYSASLGVFHSNDNSRFFLSDAYSQYYPTPGTSTGMHVETTLESPVFSTLNFTTAAINFYQYFEKNSTDTARVEISTNGTTWTTLQNYTTSQGTLQLFKFSTVTITAPYLNQATVYIRFKYKSPVATGGYGFAIDNVSISGSKSLLPTWEPIIGLYSDAAATLPYVSGTAVSNVYAKPGAGVSNYNAIATTAVDNCSITSNAAIVNVNTPSVGGIATAAATSILSGTGTTIDLTGFTGTIQWQSSLNGTTWTNISGQTSATLLTGNLNATTHYQALVTNGSCASTVSSEAIVTIITTKTLNLNLILEGLYNNNNTGILMNAASDDAGPHWGSTIADQVTVELHNGISPYALVQSFTNKILNTNGTLSINDIPANLSGNYYIVIKHRNSIATWSNLPISFASSVINYNFTTSASSVYGDNLKPVGIGLFAIFVGDVNQDEVIDLSDLVDMDTDLTNGTVAYVVYDLNGDGVVDLSDLVAIDENLTNGVVAINPLNKKNKLRILIQSVLNTFCINFQITL
jgi:hypothetical protein